MSSISQCEYDIRRYENLKLKIKSILSKLYSAVNNANNFNDEIKSKYQVDDNYTPIVSRTDNLKNDMQATCNYLSNTVLPAINLAIVDLKNEIAILEAEANA